MPLALGTGSPDLKVEIAFIANPYDASPVWTDVSTYVDSANTTRGRNYELGRTDAGTADIVLRNFDGRFDPTNTSSPYYPYVLPYRPIRITADWRGTTYNVWRGFVERWPQSWTLGGTQGVVSITAVDGMKASLGVTFGPRYEDIVTTSNPLMYLRFDGTGGQVHGSDVSGSGASTVGQTLTGFSAETNVAGLLNGVTNQAGQYTLSTTAAQAFRGADWSVSGVAVPYSIDCWFRIDAWTFTATGQRISLIAHGTAGTNDSFSAQIRPHTASPYQPRLWVADTQATPVYTDLGDLTVGTTYYLARTLDTDDKARTYVNGALAHTATAGGPFTANAGYIVGGTTDGSYSACEITVDEFSVQNEIINPSLRYNTAGTSRYAEFPQQLSSDRVTAILNTLDWPAANRSIETGMSTLLATGSVAGQTAADLLFAAAEAELGNIFIGGAGKFVFHARSHRNGATSVATFGDGTGEFPYQGDITIDFDDTYIYNDIQVTKAGSSPPVVEESADTTSQTSYGLRVLQRSEPLANTADCTGQAATLLAWYKDPRPRISSVSLEGRACPDNFAAMLGREIGDLVTAKRRPPGAPAISIDCFIDGVKHSITPSRWATEFMLTPKFPDTTY